MNFLRLISMMLIVVSCRGGDGPEKVDTVQCQPFMTEVRVSGIVTINGREVQLNNYRFIDTDPARSACNCREYTYSPERIGALTKFVGKDIKECHQMIGHPVRHWPGVWSFLDYIRRLIRNSESFQQYRDATAILAPHDPSQNEETLSTPEYP